MTIKAPSTTLSAGRNGVEPAAMLVQARGLSAFAHGTPPTAAPAPAAPAVKVTDISLHIQPHELVVVSGAGRAARSLLMKTLAGLHRPSDGEVLLDGVSLYPNRKVFAAYIGYVPAELGLSDALTVQETLRYYARLRLPRGISRDTRQQRIEDTLDAVGLRAEARRRLSALSRYQKRLASIAVELLSRPGMLVVEEGSDGADLDPVDEIKLTHLLKEIARNGPTVLQAASAGRCALIADKVLTLAPDGELAWFGPAAEALEYFRGLGQGDPARVETFALEDAQETLAGQELGKGETWAKRFQALPAYATYVDDPLNDRHPDLLLEDRPLSRFRSAAKEKQPPPRVPQVGWPTRFSLLAGRGIRQLTRQRAAWLLLLAPVLAALLDFLVSSPTMTDPLLGDPNQAPIALGLVVFLVLATSALLLTNEIVKERAVYRREARTGKQAFPYALSKFWLALLLAVYQGLVWSVIHLLATGFIGGVAYLPATWITLGLAALIGGMTGLVASALARTRQTSVILALVFVIVQFLLSGSLPPLPNLPAAAQAASTADPARYAFETMLTLSGYGTDVALDVCYQLPADKRSALTDEQKQNCTCLGDNVYSKCNFPGVRQFFSVAIERTAPGQPVPNTGSAQLPTPPQLQAGETADAYAKAVNAYDTQVQQYVSGLNTYNQSLQLYASQVADFLRSRSLEIGGAEGVIRVAYDRYGQAFLVNVLQDWMILAGMAFLLLLVLSGIQMKRGAQT